MADREPWWERMSRTPARSRWDVRQPRDSEEGNERTDSDGVEPRSERRAQPPPARPSPPIPHRRDRSAHSLQPDSGSRAISDRVLQNRLLTHQQKRESLHRTLNGLSDNTRTDDHSRNATSLPPHQRVPSVKLAAEQPPPPAAPAAPQQLPATATGAAQPTVPSPAPHRLFSDRIPKKKRSDAPPSNEALREKAAPKALELPFERRDRVSPSSPLPGRSRPSRWEMPPRTREASSPPKNADRPSHEHTPAERTPAERTPAERTPVERVHVERPERTHVEPPPSQSLFDDVVTHPEPTTPPSRSSETSSSYRTSLMQYVASTPTRELKPIKKQTATIVKKGVQIIPLTPPAPPGETRSLLASLEITKPTSTNPLKIIEGLPKDRLTHVALERFTKWFPALIGAGSVECDSRILTSMPTNPEADVLAEMTPQSSDIVMEEEPADLNAYQSQIVQLIERVDRLIKEIEKLDPSAEYPQFSVLCYALPGWLESQLLAGEQVRRDATLSTVITKATIAGSLSNSLGRGVFQKPETPPTTPEEPPPPLTNLRPFLEKMGECVVDDDDMWEVSVTDDLINLHGVFPVFDDAPDDVIFNFILENIQRKLLKYDTSARTNALREKLRRDHKAWLNSTNENLDELDYNLRFGCLPVRALLGKNVSTAPSGRWPWLMPGLQYANGSGKIDKLLLESQWFQLGAKQPISRTGSGAPFVIPKPMQKAGEFARVLPEQPTKSMCRADVLRLQRAYKSNNRQKPEVRVKEDTADEGRDNTSDQSDAIVVDKQLRLPPPEMAISKTPDISFVGPGVNWHRSALVESGVERLIDKCYQSSDEGDKPVWRRRNYLVIENSTKRRFTDEEEEVVNDSALWTFNELLMFATLVHLHGYMPRKIVPLLATTTSHQIAHHKNRFKTTQQCTILYSIIKCWISAINSKAAVTEFQQQFSSTFLTPLQEYINSWSKDWVGIVEVDAATLGHIRDFKTSHPQLVPPMMFDEDIALDMAETGAPIDSQPLLVMSDAGGQQTTVVPANSSVLLPPNTATIVAQSNKEFTVWDRSGEPPKHMVKAVNATIYQMTRNQTGDEHTKAVLGAQVLGNKQFVRSLAAHVEEKVRANQPPAEGILELFITAQGREDYRRANWPGPPYKDIWKPPTPPPPPPPVVSTPFRPPEFARPTPPSAVQSDGHQSTLPPSQRYYPLPRQSPVVGHTSLKSSGAEAHPPPPPSDTRVVRPPDLGEIFRTPVSPPPPSKAPPSNRNQNNTHQGD